MTCTCGLAKAHFICLGCGMHNVLDSEPCISCSFFRFEPAAVDETKPEPPPVAALKTKRRPRGVASTTQRN